MTAHILYEPEAYLISAAYQDDELRISSIWVGPYATPGAAKAEVTKAGYALVNKTWWQRTKIPRRIHTVDGPANYLEAFVISAKEWECHG